MPNSELVLLLDDDAAARVLRITIEHLESLVSAGDLAPIYIHTKRRFLSEAVEVLAGTIRR